MEAIFKYLQEHGVSALLNGIFLYIIYIFLVKKVNQTPCIYTQDMKDIKDKVTKINTRVVDLIDYFKAWIGDNGMKYKGRDDD